MISWFRQLDALLRGQSTDPSLLARGAAEIAVRRFAVMALLLGGAYGFFMGWYSVLTRESGSAMQLLASTLKLPLLFLLTLGVSFPSLYVFSALSGCRLSFTAVLRLLVGTITVNLAIAASMGPILGFFTLSTESYSFMIVLNVVLLGIAGVVSLGFLLRALNRLAASMAPPPATPSAPLPPTPPLPSYFVDVDSSDESGTPPTVRETSGVSSQVPPPLPRSYSRTPTNVTTPTLPGQSVFSVWIIIYSLVGVQMGWLLRPFIGNPNLPFEWFRGHDGSGGNFFQSVWSQLMHLLGAGS